MSEQRTQAERLAAALDAVRELEEATESLANSVDLLRHRCAAARLEISKILTEDKR